MRELEHEPILPLTALDAAKDFLRPYVVRGDGIDALAAGPMGISRPEYAAQIGGVARDPQGVLWVVGTHRIAVTRLADRPVWARFRLEDVYR